MRDRDERDALRGRVDSLEEQLATARKELQDHRDDDRAARVEQLERQMEDARRTLDQLGRELDAVRGRPRRSLAVPILALLAGLGICATVAGYALRGPAPGATDGVPGPVPAPPPEPVPAPSALAPEPAPSALAP
ncbi:MAG TPA: hypothetical protein VL242_04135, partial [Sorangium sp.]|nr:hypothetical protein [Sorangium sp.]